jgi:uncharacterized protein YbjT (DUF2867 family)
MSGKFLITGATGRHGATGAHVAERLLDRDEGVRLFVRRETDATRTFAERGAEVVLGDLLDQRTIAAALDGITQAYFTFSADVNIIAGAANWAQAMRSADHPVRTVMMSMPPALPDSPSPYGRASWLAEQVMQWSGIDLQIVRIMAMFQENLEMEHGETLVDSDVMRNAFGTAPQAWMSGADAADVIYTALLHPEKFDRPLAKVSGTEQISHPEIAAQLAKLLGRPIRYEQIDPATWHDELTKLHHPSMTPLMTQHLPAFAAQKAAHDPRPNDNSEFERLTGQKPRPMADFLRQLAAEIAAHDSTTEAS